MYAIRSYYEIQTIHAFSAAILRRFPVEAGVSPRFDVLDERGRAALMVEASYNFV